MNSENADSFPAKRGGFQGGAQDGSLVVEEVVESGQKLGFVGGQRMSLMSKNEPYRGDTPCRTHAKPKAINHWNPVTALQ